MLPSVLRIPSYRALWLGQAISQLGDSFYYLIFMFMVNKLTGSLVIVGYVAALETLPYLVFGPYAGVLADGMDRKKIMLASDLFSASILVLLAIPTFLAGKPPVWLLLVTPFVLSSIRVFFMPAKSAAIPNLVSTERVMEANALSATTQSVVPLLSLSVSASVLALLYQLSPMWFFISAIVLNSLSFFGSAAFIATLPAIVPDRKDAHEAHPFTDFKVGMSYIRGRHELKVLIVLLTVFKLAVAPFFVVYLAANSAWFGGKPQTLAWFEFSFFLGMVASSFAMGKANVQRPLLWFSSGLALCGLAVAGMAVAPNFWNFVLCNVIAGLAIPAADIPANTFLQVSVPDNLRGRVSSVLNMIGSGVMPIGAMLGGVMVEKCGLVNGFLIMGFGMAAACLFGYGDRHFRNSPMKTPEPVSQDRAEVAFMA